MPSTRGAEFLYSMVIRDFGKSVESKLDAAMSPSAKKAD